MKYCQRRLNPRITLKRCKRLGDWCVRIDGVTREPAWAGAHRDCLYEAIHAAICNALVWIEVDRSKAVPA